MEIWKDIDWEKFHFLRAEYLWYGLPVAIIILLCIFLYGESNAWKKHIAKHLQPYVIQKGTTWKSRLVYLFILLLFAIGFIGFLGPTWSEKKAPAKKVASKLVIALDLSQSMLTTDVSPNRLERAKFKINDFLDANPRAETALIVFAASTHTVIPFTTDYKIISDNLDGLQPHMMPQRGTGFRMLLQKLDTLFVNNKAPGKILLFTDDLDGIDPPALSALVQEHNVALNIYPMATPTGGHVPSFYNHKVALKDNGKVVNSALQADKVNALRGIEGITVVDMTLDKSDVTLLAEDISDHLIFEEKPKNEDEDWEDKGYLLVIPLMVLFLFCFRKGWSLLGVVLLVSLSSCTSDNPESKDKDNTEAFQYKDLWYTKAYQAQQEYDTKDYLAAAEGFKDPMRKGVSYYKGGNYVKAKQAFQQDSTASGQYNLGLTYVKLGDLEQAHAVFESVVKNNPEMAQAQQNLTSLEEAMAKQSGMSVDESEVEEDKPNAKNKKNDSMEDLSGGGQKATKKDMEKERAEEEAATGKRKGKELDELPDDFKSGKGAIPKNILMRKVDDDPALFLTRKFKYQVKKQQVDVEKTQTSW
ncbi:Mg-chelatase subunit ChlD [Formosa agariphila KMM 3901]|uniref:Mg-chelatase subunit ChlD n=1 Tax=Formosa agariphila (strain DSM 15362 / KCTC 12365 / LMG 23005 / KMM 3901 / M-2Alg 35-1) TaxID=1347342 RepID=T2KK64_FORAG|nr:VWA domain-containing protein [Formosa agariphila]CDF78394.1 Mg-chelatase subunit ChlD [Formosa agariphila KMM 3901]